MIYADVFRAPTNWREREENRGDYRKIINWICRKQKNKSRLTEKFKYLVFKKTYLFGVFISGVKTNKRQI